MKNKTRITPSLIVAFAIILVRHIFAFPVQAMRPGPCRAVTLMKSDLVSTWRYHLWLLGNLPTGVTTRSTIHRELADGRRVHAQIVLVGGPVSLAFIRLQIDQKDLGLFYVRHRRAPSDPIKFEGTHPMPIDLAPEHFASRLDSQSAKQLLDLLGWIRNYVL